MYVTCPQLLQRSIHRKERHVLTYVSRCHNFLLLDAIMSDHLDIVSQSQEVADALRDCKAENARLQDKILNMVPPEPPPPPPPGCLEQIIKHLSKHKRLWALLCCLLFLLLLLFVLLLVFLLPGDNPTFPNKQ